ncbi:MAG: cation:proton antiporter [Ignavibacteriales bacterium]|nr:cation:proton antiporter [Ignavibacteriales bacterium]
MGPLDHHDVLRLILAVAVVLAVGKLFGEAFRKMRQAAVVGEIVAGVLLGPTLLGALFPETFAFLFPAEGPAAHALDGFVQLAVVLLLLAVGLEVNLGATLQYGKAASLSTLFGMAIPFALGFGAARFIPELVGAGEFDPVFGFYLGAALSVSALPVVARTLVDLNLFKTRLGSATVASAMANDFVGWLVFSVFLTVASPDASSDGVWWKIAATLGFVFVALFVARPIFRRLLPLARRELSWPGGVLGAVVVVGLIGAYLAELAGAHAVFGAFIAGVALGDSAELDERTREIIQHFITNIFAPLFFVNIGLRLDFGQAFDPLVAVVIIGIASFGKIFGAGAGARLGGFDRHDSLAVGFAMNSRGVLEIVLTLYAVRLGVAGDSVFAAVVTLVVLGSVTSGPLIRYALAKKRKERPALAALSPKRVAFLGADSVEEILRALSDSAAPAAGLHAQTIYEEALRREREAPTGLGAKAALPHARLDVRRPVVALARLERGVDFGALDGEPARVVVFLVAPRSKPELHIELLAAYAKSFADDTLVERLLAASSKDEFFDLFADVCQARN